MKRSSVIHSIPTLVLPETEIVKSKRKLIHFVQLSLNREGALKTENTTLKLDPLPGDNTVKLPVISGYSHLRLGKLSASHKPLIAHCLR